MSCCCKFTVAAFILRKSWSSGCIYTRQKGNCGFSSLLKTAHRHQKHPVEMKPCWSSSPLEPLSKCLPKTFFFIGCTSSTSCSSTGGGPVRLLPPVAPTACDATRAGACSLRGSNTQRRISWGKTTSVERKENKKKPGKSQ